MDDSTKMTLAAAVAAGYVLGRTRKGKFALGVLSLAAGRSPKDLLGQGARNIAQSPQFEQLSEQIRGELLESGRSVLSAVASRGVASLTGAVQPRTRAVQDARTSEQEEEAEEAQAEEDEEDEEEEEEAADKDEEREPPKQSRPRKSAPKKTSAKKTSAKKAAANKTPAERATGKKTAAKKTAARTARSGRRR